MSFASSVSAASTCCTAVTRTINANAVKLGPYIGRRVGLVALISSLVLATTSSRPASGFEFRLTVPDQSAEEAAGVITDHAQALLDVKLLLELEEWREAQRELRQNTGYLKQDIYTLIQKKQGSVRPLLRKLYSDLFNNITKLDYAVREKDVAQVKERYNNVKTILDDILSRL